jgi:glycosyltransferase involved in cell wall biosynthesis
MDQTLKTQKPQSSAALLTGGIDKPYVFGLATSLMSKGVNLDLIGSDLVDCPDFHGRPGVNFLNLRGSHRPETGVATRLFYVLIYYSRLVHYAATAQPAIFHILWNNKFEYFDRTLLTLYYRLLGKRIVLTAHNVNAARRDGKDTRLNRLTLWSQYRLADHIFVHTEKMKFELSAEFGVPPSRISVIPFGINNSVPDTGLTPAEAKQRLGIQDGKKVLLFYGRIRASKGLELLVAAFRKFLARGEDYQLIIAGMPDRCEQYWAALQETMREDVEKGRILLRPEVIPDNETEIYFKGADVLVLPYRQIFQSGVIFLGYYFGLPVLAADVGSLKDDIVEGKTGFVFRPEDPVSLASAIEKYFASDLYRELDNRRREVRDYATERHSWDVVSQMTMSVYGSLLRRNADEGLDIGRKAKRLPQGGVEDPR